MAPVASEVSRSLTRKCFVVMPIGRQDDGSFEKHQEIYQHLIQPAVEAAHLDLICLRADEIRKTGSIIREIMDEIADADVVIADLTGGNPNVFYELGVRHALAGRSIMITQDLDKVPFDLRPYRVIQYDPSLKGAAEFREELLHYLQNVVHEPNSPDNPVLDFLARDQGRDLRSQLAEARRANHRLRKELSRYSNLWPFPTGLPMEPPTEYASRISNFRAQLSEKIIVVDDDPGGLHTVSDVPFFISLDEDAVSEAVSVEETLVFLVTDTRSHKEEDAISINSRLGRLLGDLVRKDSSRRITIISRGDSTLRGHYPEESDALRRSFEAASGEKFHCEVFCPAYIEAGRVTLQGIHWLQEGQHLRPVGLTDYGQDPAFGFEESHLSDWMRAKLVRSSDRAFEIITLEEIRGGGPEKVAERLLGNTGYTRYVCEAVSHSDIEAVALASCLVEEGGKRVFSRAAPSFVRARGGLPRVLSENRPDALHTVDRTRAGLIVVGSITDLTGRQREAAESLSEIESIELDARRLYNPFVQADELTRVRAATAAALGSGSDVILFTSDYYQESGEHPLDAKGRVLFALADLARHFVQDVGYLVAKGSDTAYLLLKQALKVRSSRFRGAVMTGVGYCEVDRPDSAGVLPFFLLPGNAGEDLSLHRLIESLRKEAPAAAMDRA